MPCQGPGAGWTHFQRGPSKILRQPELPTVPSLQGVFTCMASTSGYQASKVLQR